MMESVTYYVYTLAQPTGEVFYVGKGQKDRINDHEKQALRSTYRNDIGVNQRKCNVIREIHAQGQQIVKTKVFETPVEQDAYIYEWALIHLIYGIEKLTNKSDQAGSASPPVRVVIEAWPRTREDLEAIPRKETYTLQEFAEKINHHIGTLYRWDHKDILKAKRSPTNRRYLHSSAISGFFRCKRDRNGGRA
jgi:hypothetical protein